LDFEALRGGFATGVGAGEGLDESDFASFFSSSSLVDAGIGVDFTSGFGAFS